MTAPGFLTDVAVLRALRSSSHRMLLKCGHDYGTDTYDLAVRVHLKQAAVTAALKRLSRDGWAQYCTVTRKWYPLPDVLYCWMKKADYV